jgi:hypothetical protein
MSIQVRCGVALRPALEFTSCGDEAFTSIDGATKLFVLVDALGHGPDAAKSAKKVRDAVAATPDATLVTLFRAADRCLTGQRGAVMSAIRISGKEVTFAGIGNVDVFGPEGSPRPACRPGTLGRGVTKLREEKLQVKGGDRWVLATDGIRARDVRRVLDEVLTLHPGEAAQTLIARAGRPDDDAGVVVVDFLSVP